MVTALIGGWVSRRIETGEWPWQAAWLTALLAGSMWAWLCRAGRPLVVVSLLYDVAATLGYTVYFVATGDRLTVQQVVGVVLTLVGMVLVGSH